MSDDVKRRIIVVSPDKQVLFSEALVYSRPRLIILSMRYVFGICFDATVVSQQNNSHLV